MLSKSQFENTQKRAAELIRKSGLQITPDEMKAIEVVDFGLGDLEKEGAQIFTMVQTERISVKVLALFPYQTEPEHWHPPVGDDPGKEETIRIISGICYFYIPGEESVAGGFVPAGKEDYYTVRHEIVMESTYQITLEPGKKHWFQAGEEGTVMFSFSTIARDALDGFTDPGVDRIPKIADE